MIEPTEHVARRGAIQSLIARIYDRLGARVVIGLILAAWVITTVTGALLVVVAHMYLDLDAGEFVWFMVLAETTAIVGPAAVMWRAWPAVQGVLEWSGESRTAENAPAAWDRVARYPLVIARVAIPVMVVCLAIAMTGVVLVIEPPAWTVPPVTVAMATAVGGAYILIIFGLEFVLRPMLEDIAAQLPADFEPTHSTWSVHSKSLLPLPVVTVVAAVGVGGFADLVSTGPERLSFTYGIAVPVVGIATAIFFIITRSALDPIVDLTTATKRVRDGDLSATVPVVTADDLGRLTANFNQMLVQLRESRARIVAASDEARRKVERDLHDGAQQELVLLNLKLGLVERSVAGDPEAAAMVAEAKADLARALEQLRDLAHGIYPAALENDGLGAALGDAVRRAGIPAQVECDGTGRHPRELEAAVYFCCLEALQNAAKHAGEGARARVRLGVDESTLRFEVADDGAGFDVPAGTSNAGLQNMTDRIGALGGRLRIESAPGRGTKVKGTVPLGD